MTSDLRHFLLSSHCYFTGGVYLDMLFIAVAGVFEENCNIAYSLHLNCITTCECELY